MKKIKILCLLLFAILFFSTGAAFAANSPLGIWRSIDPGTGTAKALITIYEENGLIYGKITKVFTRNQNVVCSKCKGEFKDQKLLGLRVLWDLKKNGPKYTGGRVLDPETGKDYNCTIEVMDNGRTLKVRGFVRFYITGENRFWIREK